MDDSNPDLETFRQQWRAEVLSKSKVDNNTQKPKSDQNRRPPRKHAFDNLPSQRKVPQDESHDSLASTSSRRLSSHRKVDHNKVENEKGESSKANNISQPSSALDHYEKAVERESQGNLGDSLDLYRKAFKLDDQVDKIYKKKHFPAPPSQAEINKSTPAEATTPAVPKVTNATNGPTRSIHDLVASFSHLSIEPVPPSIEGTEAPPCPLGELPHEILVHILMDLAMEDVGSFTRTAQVCKKLAFVVMTEEQIWKTICSSTKFGFPAMHYAWQCQISGDPVYDEVEVLDDTLGEEESTATQSLDKNEVTESLYQAGYSLSWQKMFRHRPRIRFNGCYISTVNYIRAGQATQSATTWGSPVHIVTYFRYLRFYRDGTVISLLTTVEPTDVVHNLTKELQETHRKGGAAYLPTIFMQNALKGRWRLSSITDEPEMSHKDAEGDVFVETEGANEKYLYRMKFSLANAGKTVRNNRLNWQGFWCYNILTDDTGDFHLKNAKPYHFSRVRSYGLG